MSLRLSNNRPHTMFRRYSETYNKIRAETFNGVGLSMYKEITQGSSTAVKLLFSPAQSSALSQFLQHVYLDNVQ